MHMQIPNIPSEVWASVITLIGAILVAWITHAATAKQAAETAQTLAEREDMRFREQRLWDARREIYSDIIGKMREYRRAMDVLSDGFLGAFGMGPEEYFHTAYDEHNREAFETYRKLVAAFDDGRLMLSEPFAARFDDFLKSLWAREDDDPPNYAIDGYKLVSAAHDELLALALKEISSTS